MFTIKYAQKWIQDIQKDNFYYECRTKYIKFIQTIKDSGTMVDPKLNFEVC